MEGEMRKRKGKDVFFFCVKSRSVWVYVGKGGNMKEKIKRRGRRRDETEGRNKEIFLICSKHRIGE